MYALLFIASSAAKYLSYLVIHPDKCPHARAPEAFDILKKVGNFLVLKSSFIN